MGERYPWAVGAGSEVASQDAERDARQPFLEDKEVGALVERGEGVDVGEAGLRRVNGYAPHPVEVLAEEVRFRGVIRPRSPVLPKAMSLGNGYWSQG